MASVIGLAPIRPGLKDRLLDLLCIHGQKSDEWRVTGDAKSRRTDNKLQFMSLVTRHNHLRRWSLRSVLRRRLLVFSEALICLSYSGSLRDGYHYASSRWSSRAVMLRGLSLIGRGLCF